VRQLPTGTLTLLFTDIEGSTLLLQQLGSDYIQAVSAARESLSEEAFQAAWTEGSRTPLEQVLLAP
jgi:hypothetical protein